MNNKLKSFLIVFPFCLVFCDSFCQAPNDDCSTATDLGTLSLSWDQICPDMTNDYSVAIADSNTIATPSSPYYSMSGCNGYTGSTSNSADDVWFKFRNQLSSIQLSIPHSDTTHINLYQGTDCNSLQPIGCWTIDNTTFMEYFYSNNDTLNQYNYIQVSGISPGRKTSFALCIRSFPSVSFAYGVININTSLEIETLKLPEVFPNPFSSQISLGNFKNGTLCEIFDLYGNKVYSDFIHAEMKQVNLEKLKNGMYLMRIEQNKIEKLYKLIKID